MEQKNKIATDLLIKSTDYGGYVRSEVYMDIDGKGRIFEFANACDATVFFKGLLKCKSVKCASISHYHGFGKLEYTTYLF